MRGLKESFQDYSLFRFHLIWVILILLFLAIIGRLVHLQIIRHDDMLAQAKEIQTKSLEIEAQRGKIYALNDGRKILLVTNQRSWTVFADTYFVENINDLVGTLTKLGFRITDKQLTSLNSQSRYVVLEKKVSDQRKDELQTRLDDLKIKGVYFQETSKRDYLEGSLAAQVLGFVDDDKDLKYGLEQFYDEQLTGTPGLWKRTTDVHGVPLVFVKDNIRKEPVAGLDLTLTLDISLQNAVEKHLKEGIAETESLSGTAIVMDADSGAILSLANYPTFEPANFKQYSGLSYVNNAVERTLEPASTMKVLFMATALNEGVVDPQGTFYNPLFQVIDGKTISNFVFRQEGNLDVSEVLNQSLNTGTTELLKRLSPNHSMQTIDLADRQILYDYYTKKFRLQQKTNIDLPGETIGHILKPDYPYSPSHAYAVMTFGQTISITPIQLAAAYGAVFNGGDYYKPYVVAQVGDEVVKSTLVEKNIVKTKTTEDLRDLMPTGQYYIASVQYDNLKVAAKTGSGQIADGENGYLPEVANGLMVGFVKSSQRNLIVLVVVEQPQVRFAGGQGAGPIWAEIVRSIVNLGRTN